MSLKSCNGVVFGVLLATVAIIAAQPAGAQMWWDEFPRIVEDVNLSVVQQYHGSIGFSHDHTDPGWGTYGQMITERPWVTTGFHDAGLKTISYFETYGTATTFVVELGDPTGQPFTPVLHTYWNWPSHSGGTSEWVGVHNFWDDEEFARPYTRTHSRYGAPAMTYPDATVATGYNGASDNPLNSRIYDASIAKDILGNLGVDGIAPAGGPTDILVDVKGVLSGHLSFYKDSACPAWADYTYASTLLAADGGTDGMWTDNFSAWDSFGNPSVKIAFGDWSVARFRDHLSANFTAGELTAMGVADVNTFDVRADLRTKMIALGGTDTNLNDWRWRHSFWLDDPIWRAFRIFKRQSLTEALTDYYDAVKQAAADAGKEDFLVAGNDIPGFSFGMPRDLPDIVSTEVAPNWQLDTGPRGIMLPPAGRHSVKYNLARVHAKSPVVNVWMYLEGPSAPYVNNTVLASTLYYEMLAANTMPMIHPNNARCAGNLASDSAFFEFVESATSTLSGRVPVAEIGLYYSSSSILATMTPGGYYDHSDQPHQFAL